jgi:hypothetical protein
MMEKKRSVETPTTPTNPVSTESAAVEEGEGGREERLARRRI